MLSPSNPAQKNLSEEDDSGSDAGSEVSLEPETDRFGFILTNGATAGSVGPPPELVRQREAKWINIILQWDSMLLKKTSKVKVQCQKGIPASLRAKCWPLLCAASDRMKQNENLYKTLDSQPALKSWVDLIERDLDRQFPFHEMFLCKDGHGQQGLFRVLKAYTQYQPEEGYCQAQGPVAAVLLMNMPAEEAFWCLVQISEQYLPGYYSPLLEGVLFDAGMLTWVLRRTCPAAHKHLQHHGVEPLMFATDWLMCLFVRHLPFNTLLRVWDLFFCYGVRVLFQVAVVLVHRVLGRAEQRKQCQGQMETLEQLRGIREQVHDEDDAFIAEVCSVPLSAKDLAKRTEKELEKWRKERPASTFDPRGRSKGYRMAWARVRQTIENQDRKERERGNLSVPLSRSASTLSLSPSLLHKKLKKGGKGPTGEGSGKVVRHRSMGAKEDWRSWNELNFKKVQGVLEETDADEHMKLTNRLQSEKKELSEEPVKTDKAQNISLKNTEETDMVKEQKDQSGTGIMEKEENQPTEKEDDKMLLGQRDKKNVENKQNCSPAKVQNVENDLQPTECTSDREQGEELGPDSQSQVLEEHSHKDQDQETERQVSESEHSAAAEEKQSKTQRDTVADTYTDKETEVGSGEEQITLSDKQVSRNEQQVQAGTVIEVLVTRIETMPCSETDTDIEAATSIRPNLTLETENQEEVTTEADKSSQGDTVEEKYHSTESLEGKDESNTQTETETEGKVEESAATQDELETERGHTDSKTETKTAAETFVLPLPACIQHQKDTDTASDAEHEVEIPVEDDTAEELCKVFAPCSSKGGDTVPSELREEKEGIVCTVYPEVLSDNDEAQAQETPQEPKINAETPDSAAPTVKEGTPEQAGTVNLTTKPDGTTSSEEISISEESIHKEPELQVTTGPLVDEVQENTAEEDTFISTPDASENPNTDNNPEGQNKDDNSSLAQASRNRSSRSSGDFCMRKSSSSRGSWLARKLSEDLFTVPTDTSQLESVSNHAEVKHPEAQSTPEDVNSAKTSPDMTQSLEVSSLSVVVTERTVVEQGAPAVPKRFGLFSRLRGEQPKKAKAKEKGSQKMQVPKILIQDFSDGTGIGRVVEEEADEKLRSRERRRRRRENKRREKEEEKMRKLKDKETEKERERRKPQTRGKSFQVQKEKGSDEMSQLAKTGSQTLRYSASYAESYF